jgi:SAM-dependent methyltransferase
VDILRKVRQHGLLGSARKAVGLVGRQARYGYYRWAVRHAKSYEDPTAAELGRIEADLRGRGIAVHDYVPRAEALAEFRAAGYFVRDGYKSAYASVWDEKVLEHWIAAERLGLMTYRPADVYVDIAAGNSPWAQILRTRLGISAFAIDLGAVGADFRDLPYYRTEDATATAFADASVSGASLQCAYEMFMRDDDTKLLGELARILRPGGKAIVVPLYLHTHYCAYATPEYYGKGNADARAIEYVCRSSYGVPSARFYDARELQARVLAPIERLGMRYQLLALRNKAALGEGIYCHFILEISK